MRRMLQARMFSNLFVMLNAMQHLTYFFTYRIEGSEQLCHRQMIVSFCLTYKYIMREKN